MMIRRPVRVLIVDDSAFIRKVFKEILERHPLIQVVGAARNGQDALAKVAELEPDLLLLDLYMPDMDGVQFLREQMQRNPIPILLCSSAEEYDEDVFAAMDAGALDFIQKPTSRASESLYSMEGILQEKVLAFANAAPQRLSANEALKPALQVSTPKKDLARASRMDVLVIGTSTGGPQALRYLIPQIPADFPLPIAMVLHMPEGYTRPFAERLNKISDLEVLEAEEGLVMKPGRAILAKAGYHLMLVREGDDKVVCHISASSLQPALHQPSVDILFRSAAAVYGSKTLAFVLTGMGRDGTAGAAWIKAEGGLVFSEAEETSVVFGMPHSIIEAGLSDKIVPLHDALDAILEIV
jgi:two-component system, chemotaxis family, protein-glutamate methylesterase/glutaminase